MKKKITWILVIGLILAFCVGCGNNDSGGDNAEGGAETTAPATETPATEETPTAENLQITFVTPLLGHPVWLTARYSSEDAAAEIGATLNWVGPADIDMEEQVRQIELAITENVDGIISCPLNPSAFEDVYSRAMEKGIIVINTQVDTSENTRTAYIGTDEVNFGRSAAEALAEKMGGTANIAILVTSLDSENQMNEKAAAESVWAEKYPEMNVLVTEVTNSDTAQAASVTNSLISAYPELDVIWCLESSAPAGAAQAVMERGAQDKITILGVDDTDEVLDLIVNESIWGTLSQDYYTIGYEAVMMIYQVKNGQSVPSVTDSGSNLITVDTVLDYMANR